MAGTMRHAHPASFILAVVIAFGVTRPAAGAPPTFDDVGPILARRCGTCHRPDGAGPFSLLTYDAAARHARQIVEVTRQRLMPPWKVTPGVNQFRDKEPLTDEELESIEAWVRAGAPAGRTAPRAMPDTPSPPAIAPDLIVHSTPYALRADGPDVFQSFAIAVRLDRARYVAGMEFRPSIPGVIHHADLLVDRTRRSRDAIASGQHAEGLLPRSASFPPGFVLGWAPGQVDTHFPGGLSWRIEPGTDLIVQVHLVPTGKPETLTFSVGFYFTDQAPPRTPAMLRLSRQGFQVPAGRAEYVVTDSYVLPVAVDLLAVRPHAHAHARSVTATAELPDGTVRPLLAIDDWDFRWQHTYEYVSPMALPRGTRVSMRYTYDNSPAHPRLANAGRAVEWGPLASDEMADLWLQVVPRDGPDLERLVADFRPKALAEDARGYEHLLRTRGAPALVREDLAAVHLELGQIDLAVRHLAAAAAMNPGSGTTRYNYAVGLARAGERERALAEYRAALDVAPHLTAARFNLANLLDDLGQPEAAIGQYREVLDVEPEHSAARTNLAVVLMRLGRSDEAMEHLRAVIEHDPTQADAHYNIGMLLQARGQHAAAYRAWRRALELRPAWPSALAQAARALLADPQVGDDDVAEASRLAARAVELSNTRDPELLEVLAMTHAAAGRISEAIQILEDTIAFMPAGDIRERLLARAHNYRTIPANVQTPRE